MRMNKILLGLLVGGAFSLASCSDDDFTEVHSSLTVTSAETSFAAAGETKVIQVSGPLASVYSNASWLTATQEGQQVTVTADINGDMQSRNALVVLKASATDSTIVNISQFGARYESELPKEMFVLSHATTEAKYRLYCDVPVVIEVSDSWIHAEKDGDSLTVSFDANPGKEARSGHINMSLVNGADYSISVQQFNILGNYELSGRDMSSGASVTLHGSLKSGETGMDIVFAPVEYPDLVLPFTFDISTSKVMVNAGRYCGMSGRYYVYTTIVNGDKSLQTLVPTASMSGALTLEGGLYSVSLEDNGSCWTDSKAEIIRMMTFMRQNPTTTNISGPGVIGIRNPLLKQVAASSAKPF